MKALTHITAGRTAIKALLVAVVLTAGIAGTVGTAAAEPIDGKGNDVMDGKGNDVLTAAFPIDNFTASVDSSRAVLAFPIDNLTVTGAAWDVGETDPIRSVAGRTQFHAQDMDPYAVPRGGLPQDMDPY